MGEAYLKGSALDFLHADHVQRKELIEGCDGIDNHTGEEVLLMGNQLRTERRGGALLEQFTVLSVHAFVNNESYGSCFEFNTARIQMHLYIAEEMHKTNIYIQTNPNLWNIM